MIQTQPQRRRQAQRIVQNFTLGSAVTTFSLTILFNALFSSWSTLLMVERLSDLYGVPYSEQLGKGVLAAVLVGAQSGWTTLLMTRAAPFVGLWTAGAPSALLNGTLTYAIGMSLVEHYEAGGTLSTYEPKHANVYWQS
ncbi:MAG: hypothetical protein ACI9EW_000590 [Cellvibrionaceae bacterium]|jgi:uncharacterized protein (DUF697 family)